MEALLSKSREALLAITDRLLELIPLRTAPKSENIILIQRLTNRLSWHLGIWKSWGTSDTAERVQAGLNLVSWITPMSDSERWDAERWMVRRDLMVRIFQNLNSMALIPDKKRLNPLMIREIHGQIETDLKAIRLQLGAAASRN